MTLSRGPQMCGRVVTGQFIPSMTRRRGAHSPVLDFKPLVQPPAEEQWLGGNFLHVHTLEVYVDARTFFAQEFCQTQKK